MQRQLFRRQRLIIFAVSLVITLILANIPSYALTVNEVPNPRQQNGGWVTDMVDMISPQAETQLNQMISQLEKENGTEIAVVTVPTTKPESTPKAFTTKLFNTWGIGKKGQNNGILFLVSKGDRRTEIETGTGITNELPNAKVSSIIRQQVTPQFKKGEFEAGILAGTKALINELSTDIEINYPRNDSESEYEDNSQSTDTNIFNSSLGILFGLVLCGFIFQALAKLFDDSDSDSNYSRRYSSRGNSYSNYYSSYDSSYDNNCSRYDNNYSSDYSSDDYSSDDYSSDDSNDDYSSDDDSDFGGGESDGDGGGDDW
ncbi:MAG: TPM domain-containing protein [Cyanobacteria bacterium P01_C01_bin.38]